jgi:hypothetical protein
VAIAVLVGSVLPFAGGRAGAQVTRPPCAECITVIVEAGQTLAIQGPLNALAILVRTDGRDWRTAGEALEALRAQGAAPGLLIAGLPGESLNRDALALASQLFFDLTGAVAAAPSSVDELAFRLKTRLTEARGIAPEMKLGVIATADQRAALRDRDIAPYVDFLAQPAAPPVPRSWPPAGEPYARVEPPDSEGAPARDESVRWLWAAPRDVLALRAFAEDMVRAMPLLVADLVPGGASEVFCDRQPVPTYLHPKTLDTIALVADCPSSSVRTASPNAERIRLSTGEELIRIAAAEGQFASDVSVLGRRELSVEEIIARHQAAIARHRSVVSTLISSGTMTLTFEAPGFAAPIVITSTARIFEGAGRTEIEQRSILVNGVEFASRGIPRLPIIEPERVASPPLAITLSDVYRYSLAGRARIGETDCYVVDFEPLDPAMPLFTGRAWIAVDGFAIVRIAATQTGLRGPIVSSEQVDEFARTPEDVWLLARSEVRQLYEGAGHRTPIHRVLQISHHAINPPDFSAQQRAAYASGAIMLRDTPQGFRYLRRNPDAGAAERVEPEITKPAQSVRTLALGVIVDPNISRPLPFAGLSYVDFNLFGTGTQLNAFFGGTYGQLAFSVPSIGGTRWQVAGRAFGIASSYNDRAFVNGRERYEWDITQRPAHASVWTLRALTPRFTIRAGYELDYTQFEASSLTATTFTVPPDQVAHSFRLALEGQRAGWSASLWWAGTRRSGWRPWGAIATDYAPDDHDYQRYGVTLARPFVLEPSLIGRIEAAWMNGHDLDRFSRYAFGTFDNRLRGYPSALIRYDRGGVVRTALAWSARKRFRVDGFLDSAYVHDPGFGGGLRNYTGVGAAIEVPAPLGMLAAVEWGYGFQGVNSNGRKGTQVVRVSAFKIF